MEELIGKIAKLPDGTRVLIEDVEDGRADTRRIEGPNEGIPAYIDIEKLELLDDD